MIRYYPSYQLYNNNGDCDFRGQPVPLVSAGYEIKLSSNSETRVDDNKSGDMQGMERR